MKPFLCSSSFFQYNKTKLGKARETHCIYVLVTILGPFCSRLLLMHRSYFRRLAITFQEDTIATTTLATSYARTPDPALCIVSYSTSSCRFRTILTTTFRQSKYLACRVRRGHRLLINLSRESVNTFKISVYNANKEFQFLLCNLRTTGFSK